MALFELNHYLFRLIHTQGIAHDVLLKAALFFSDYLTILVSTGLLAAAILRRGVFLGLFLKALILTLISATISNLCDDFLYLPRPFALGLAQPLVAHAASNSFPSSHMLVISTVALSYVFSVKHRIGLALVLCAIAVGWSRVYLGVHFPFDVVGSVVIALLVVMLMQRSLAQLAMRLQAYKIRLFS
jgi:undecaprenyl-diphosphatase